MSSQAKAVLRAAAECPSHSLANVSVRDLTFSIDEPTERGGTNTGPTPTDTAVAALIGCTNVIAHKCAGKLGVDIGELTIDAKCYFNRGGVTLAEEVEVPFEKIILTVKSNSQKATQAQLEEVAVETKKYCPLSKLFLNAGTEIEQSWDIAFA